MTAHEDFLRRNSRSRDTVVAAVADNCRFDERAGTERWNRFDALLSELVEAGGTIDWKDWDEASRLHLDQYCNVRSLSVPDAFLDINRNAWLDALSENQSLVRIETLARPLQSSNLDLGSLIDLLQRADDGDGDAASAVRSFVDAWNQRRMTARRLPHSTTRCSKRRTTMIGRTRFVIAGGLGTTGSPAVPNCQWL
ncbi:MAG: hypothetical protein OXQ31_24485 [Spirochaetaceae bacterium]|nr:hypothetical protein [Spirochaetaceae bacterium]